MARWKAERGQMHGSVYIFQRNQSKIGLIPLCWQLLFPTVNFFSLVDCRQRAECSASCWVWLPAHCFVATTYLAGIGAPNTNNWTIKGIRKEYAENQAVQSTYVFSCLIFALKTLWLRFRHFLCSFAGKTSTAAPLGEVWRPLQCWLYFMESIPLLILCGTYGISVSFNFPFAAGTQ